MVCIYCSNNTKVSNSRHQKRSNSVWRRRCCLDCQAIVSTIESIDLSTAILVSEDNDHTPFLRDKLLISIHDSCKHRKTSLKDSIALTDTIISMLLPKIKHASITKEDIKQTVQIVLEKFDTAAAVQYQAFHP